MKIKITNPKLRKRVKELMKERNEEEPSEYTLLRASFEVAYDEDAPDHAFLLRAGKELSVLRDADDNRRFKAGELWTPQEVQQFFVEVTKIICDVLVGLPEPFHVGPRKYPGIEEDLDEIGRRVMALKARSPDLSKRK